MLNNDFPYIEYFSLNILIGILYAILPALRATSYHNYHQAIVQPAKGLHVCTGSHEWNDKVTSCPHTQATVPIQQAVCAGRLQGLRSRPYS